MTARLASTRLRHRDFELEALAGYVGIHPYAARTPPPDLPVHNTAESPLYVSLEACIARGLRVGVHSPLGSFYIEVLSGGQATLSAPTLAVGGWHVRGPLAMESELQKMVRGDSDWARLEAADVERRAAIAKRVDEAFAKGAIDARNGLPKEPDADPRSFPSPYVMCRERGGEVAGTLRCVRRIEDVELLDVEPSWPDPRFRSVAARMSDEDRLAGTITRSFAAALAASRLAHPSINGALEKEKSK